MGDEPIGGIAFHGAPTDVEIARFIEAYPEALGLILDDGSERTFERTSHSLLMSHLWFVITIIVMPVILYFAGRGSPSRDKES